MKEQNSNETAGATNYRIGITQKGTLRDALEIIWYGKGQDITIRGKVYHIRESGVFSLLDKTVSKVREDTLRKVSENGGKRWARGKYTSIPVHENSREDEYRVTFTRAEEVPDNTCDTGNHEYRIVEGARYRVDFKGDFNLSVVRHYKYILIERAIDEIRRIFREENTLSEKMSASVRRGLSHRIAEYFESKINECEQRIKKLKTKRDNEI